MNDRNIHIALLQETLHNNVDLHMTGYTPYPCNCENCRGVITYVRNDVQCDVSLLDADQPNDIQKANVWYGNKKLTFLTSTAHQKRLSHSPEQKIYLELQS